MSKNQLKSYSKRISPTTTDIAEVTKSDDNNKIAEENLKNNKNDHVDKNISILALIAIMELGTESQSFRRDIQPMKGRPSNKIKVLLNSGSNGDLFFLQEGQDNPFTT